MDKLPKCVYLKHGAYYLVKNNKWKRLGRDYGKAMLKYRAIMAGVEIEDIKKEDAIKAIITDGYGPIIGIKEILEKAVPAVYSGPGVYFLIKDREIVYVGQSVNVSARLGSHSASIYKDFDSFFCIECEKEKLDALESVYIKLLNPLWNTAAGRYHRTGETIDKLAARHMMESRRKLDNDVDVYRHRLLFLDENEGKSTKYN